MTNLLSRFSLYQTLRSVKPAFSGALLTEECRGIPPRRKGVSIIEILVTIGIAAILFAFALPALRLVRGRARDLSDLVKIQQIGIATTAYSASNRDLVPTIFSPVYLNRTLGDPWESVEIGGTKVIGAWFMNSLKYHYLLAPLTDRDVLAHGAPANPHKIRVFGSVTALHADFRLAESFYADPDYWTRDKQRGPVQWRTQRLADVAFPSKKGLLHQGVRYDPRGDANGETIGFGSTANIAVSWSDGSASEQQYSSLLPGVPNNWHYGISTPLSPKSNGLPVADTEFGILGLDR